MCEPGKTIKLCTCEGLEINPQASWKVIQTGDFKELHFVGSFMAPSDMATRWGLVQEKLLSDLNACNCFDVEYEPQDGDWLSISLEDWQFDFNFTSRAGQVSCWTLSGDDMSATNSAIHIGNVKFS